MRSAWIRVIWVLTTIALVLAPLGGAVPSAASMPGASAGGDSPDPSRRFAQVPASGGGFGESPGSQVDPAADEDPNLPANLRRLAETDAPVRLIVQLADPPLASYAGGAAGLPATKPAAGGRIDVQSVPAAQYSAFLAGKRSGLVAALTTAAPGAVVQRQYDTVLNGLAVQTTGASIDRIAGLPGVKRVTVARRYELDLEASLPAIGLISGTLGSGIDTGLWAAVGGHEHAGEGVKVAIIDSGIYVENPLFSPAGFTCPPGFPKYDPGFAAYANCKVVVARAYFRPDDPPDPATDGADPVAHASIEHGSHTAGTVGGVYSTTTSYLSAGIPPISGVAPRAWLMNYRVFYKGVSTYVGAHDPELIAAIEDAVRDGADVVNNSWGSTVSTSIVDDPLINAYDAAVDAGLVVVFSNGNTGAGQQTTASPGQGEKFISVGATTSSRLLANRLDAVGASVPITVTNIAAYPGNGPAITTTIGPAPYVDSKTETNSANTLGCSAFSAGLFAGQIALIERGTCNPLIKVNNAASAGALAVVLISDYDVAGRPNPLSGLQTTTIPAVVVERQLGLNLRSWYVANPTSATLQVTADQHAFYNSAWQDAVASFSSRGPSLNFNIKPDVAAPGVNILSAYLGGFKMLQGTSMAAPHVSGAAALLRQLHRDWSPAQIKSALMATAATPVGLSPSPIDRGAGRIDLGAAGNPGLTFDLPSLGFGAVAPGTGPMTLTVNARNVGGADAAYSLSIDQATVPNPNLTVATSTAEIGAPAGGTASFQVVLNPRVGTPPSDYYGQVNLTDGVHNLHIPYWVRVLNLAGLSPAGNKVLLVDDDLSNCAAGATGTPCKGAGGFGNYRSYWTQTLTNLGVPFDVWDTNPASTTLQRVPWDVAQQYGRVVWFTGDSPGHAPFLVGVGTDAFRNFLSNDGRLIASGQDLVTGLTMSGYTSPTTGSLFGSVVLTDTLSPTPPSRPSLQADPLAPPFVAGQVYDISAITTTGGIVPDGARNQRSVDELQPVGDEDKDSLPLFVATGVTGTIGNGTVGTLLYSEPTLERLAGQASWSHLGYRTATLGFGLEAVNNNTGYGSREQLLGSLLSWLDDQVTVTGTWLSPTTGIGVGQPAAFRAEAHSSLGVPSGQTVPIQQFRWDFGDGTPIQTSAPGAEVQVASGWNNVSLPASHAVQVTASGLIAELASQGIVVDQVVRWYNGGWQSHLANFPVNDFPIDLGQGYFISSRTFGTWHPTGNTTHVFHSFTQPGAYRVRVEAIDAFGHRAVQDVGSVTVSSEQGGPAPSIEVRISTGWNNLSLPAPRPTQLTASGLIAELAGQGIVVDQVVRWHNGGWQSHLASFPANDFPIELGLGYFVRSQTVGTWRPAGP